MIDLIHEGFGDEDAERFDPDGGDGPGKDARDDVPVDEASALGPAKHLEMWIVAQDPKVRDAKDRILRTKVRVAEDRFRRPFQSHRFHVVSYDPEKGGPAPEFRLLDDEDRFASTTEPSDTRILTSHDFHAQNVFAIASRTLAVFEAGLGRRVPWDFPTHQLYLIPHGMLRNNAGYDANKRALIFGIAEIDGARRYSCLSHDVIAHETTHAILDGLRPGFFEPGLPDQGGFHEGFADVVALLSVFAVPVVLDRGLADVAPTGAISQGEATRKALQKSVLFQIAEEFGEAVHGRTGRPLRSSLERLPPGGGWRHDPEYLRVHDRGEVLVASVASALLDMWLGRLKLLLEDGPVPRRLAAEEGAKAAEHLLQMVIRAIDYCPPLEFEYEDFLDAVLWSDQQVAPDDEHRYRDAVIAGFGRYDIRRPRQDLVAIAKLKRQPRYARFNFGALQSDRDELFRFMWENDELLGLDFRFTTYVESVRPSIRVGPDGFVVRETVVTYIQQIDGTVDELRRLSLDPSARHRSRPDAILVPPGDLDPTQPARVYGGGTIIFDQFARPKYHFHKPLLDWDRQTRRLDFIAQNTDAALTARLGVASSRRDAIAAAHRPDRHGGERW
jgi:hypothetical protein